MNFDLKLFASILFILLFAVLIILMIFLMVISYYRLYLSEKNKKKLKLKDKILFEYFDIDFLIDGWIMEFSKNKHYVKIGYEIKCFNNKEFKTKVDNNVDWFRLSDINIRDVIGGDINE